MINKQELQELMDAIAEEEKKLIHFTIIDEYTFPETASGRWANLHYKIWFFKELNIVAKFDVDSTTNKAEFIRIYGGTDEDSIKVTNFIKWRFSNE